MSDYDDYYGGTEYEDYDPTDYDDGRDDYDYDDRENDYDDHCYDAYDDYDPRDDIDYEDDEEVDLDQLRSYIVGKEYKRFGYYRCDPCGREWRSAKTYCKYEGEKDGKQVFKPVDGSRQGCIKCEKYYSAYKNQPLKGSDGSVQTPAHISRLCERCQTGKKCNRV